MKRSSSVYVLPSRLVKLLTPSVCLTASRDDGENASSRRDRGTRQAELMRLWTRLSLSNDIEHVSPLRL